MAEPSKPVVESKPTETKDTPVEADAADDEADGDDDPSKDNVSKDKPAKYHVSQNKDDKNPNFKKWRVRKEGSTKTIKYFETQKRGD